ncbi:putative WD repeat-containing protein [Diplonema papillatum]|nr:putative WD repeat-containing protein [Diplonema papillatum]|eukprot:gene17678-27206_t
MLDLFVRTPTGDAAVSLSAEGTVGHLRSAVAALGHRRFRLRWGDRCLDEEADDELIAELGLTQGDVVHASAKVPWEGVSQRLQRGTNGKGGSVVFHPDNAHVVTSGRGCFVHVLAGGEPAGEGDGARGGWEIEATPLDDGATAFDVALDAAGDLGVSGHKDGTVRVWEVASGRLVKSIDAHYDWVCAVTVSEPPGLPKRIVSASRDRALKVWDFGSGTLAFALKAPPLFFASTPHHAQELVLVAGAGSASVLSVSDGSLLTRISGPETFACLALSPDNAVLACGSTRGAEVYTYPSGELLRTLYRTSAPAHAVSVCVEFVAGYLVAGVAGDVRIWCPETWSHLATFSSGSRVLSLSASPDRRALATSHADHSVVVWR